DSARNVTMYSHRSVCAGPEVNTSYNAWVTAPAFAGRRSAATATRRLNNVLCLLVVISLAVGCGSGAPSDAPASASRSRIGVSFDLLNEIRRAELEAIQAEARRQNAAVTVVVANNSADEQRAQISGLINNHRVDAIIAIAQDRDKIVTSIQ